MNTLLLDVSTWDLVVDAGGNIAMASDPYSLAQDAASAVRTFQGECYYDTTVGVPYWAKILGKYPPINLMKSLFSAAALTVPEVTAAQCFLNSLDNRTITGQVQIATESGVLPVSL